MASISKADYEFVKAEQAALKPDDQALGRHKGNMRDLIGNCTDEIPDTGHRLDLADAADEYVEKLRLQAGQGDVISLRELMKRLRIGQ